MAFAINTNVAALNSYRNLSNTQNDISKSLEKLSTGLRINRAADDAAGLSISEGLRSQVNGLNVAARNAQDGISVIQTAEGALTEVHSILQRMRDLAVQAGNDSNNPDARKAIQTEVDGLVSELGRISESTNFNGTKLLDGTAGVLSFQVGADGNSSSRIGVDLSTANVAALTDTLKGVDSTGTALTGAVNFNGFKFGAEDETYTFAAAGGTPATFDVDIAKTDSSEQILAKLQAKAGDSYSVYGDNINGFTIADNTGVVTAFTITEGTTTAGAGLTDGVDGTEAAGLSFTSNAAAQTSVNLLDEQIKAISTARSEMGASQNRFEHSIKHINISAENLSASESRIRDADMALEMASFTKSQIMSQAGTAMLAQANQINQGVLQLLG